MKIQSVLFPSKEICNEESLYFHREDSWILFDGYFNLFYLEKHHKYNDIDKLVLNLELEGINKLSIMHDRDVISETVFSTGRKKLDSLKRARGVHGHRLYSFELPYDEYKKGVFWFKVLPASESFFVDGLIEGSSKKNSSVDVNIAVNICTYKREPYVIRNMTSLKEWLSKPDIMGNIPLAAEHMKVFIIDNGKTLSSYESMQSLLASDDKIRHLIEIIPNANTGGTGGFSRGMREAINNKAELGLTHLLMMDDDAVFDPDLFVRLYGFLSLLKAEYHEITVGGALMREDYKYIQHASGEWFTDFKVINEHPLEDMRGYETCTSKWMTGTQNEHSLYGAWWCCCYNMSAITEENMPLPIFVHHDDIQFGMGQTDRGIVFLNGIGVWHQGFETVFPGVKQYYNMRNTLITMNMFEPHILQKKMKMWSIKRYIGMLISYRYADCEFVFKGYEDYLRGRQWLLDSDSESIHEELMAEYKRICPFDTVDNVLADEPDKGEILNYIKRYDKGLSPDELRAYYSHERFNGKLIKKLTFNGWFLPATDKLKVITPLDSPWDTYRHSRILLYEPATKRGVIMKRSNKEFIKGLKRIIKMATAW